jgi:hypothetical protein
VRRQLDCNAALIRRRDKITVRVVCVITQHVRGSGGSLPHDDALVVLRTAVLELSNAPAIRSCAV